jgi:hypothetical protein
MVKTCRLPLSPFSLLSKILLFISHLCLTVPPLAALGATALVGDLLPAPTDVELGAAGYKIKTIIIRKVALGMCKTKISQYLQKKA